MVLVGVVAGCGEQGVPVPSDRFHRLSIGAPATVYQKPPVAGTLEVVRFSAIDVLEDRAIVFTEKDSPDVLHQYHYQLWADAPPHMLQVATVDYLRQARLADQVVTTGRGIVPTYTLRGDIKKLEHVVGGSSSVVVELEFALREHKSGNVVWVKSYTANKAAKNDSVGAATRAFSQAVQEILSNLTAELARR
jgi:ABC-type uncharacterized transport system auxiliary subunit